MDLSIAQLYVIAIIVFLVIALYREWFNPAISFFVSAVALLLGGIITPEEFLKGLSNQQIILIFLLVLITAGIRNIYGSGFFDRLFNPRLSPRAFLARMMITVSSVSAFLNNTPIVAFMIPYVKDWAEKTGQPASKFLIPLSFATILGGMITVIGTSTNLVLAGLISEYKLPMLNFTDFLFLGLLVTVAGFLYLYFVAFRLLPSNANKIEDLRENLKEYIVETEISANSSLVGKTVKEAGLRNLKEVFLVEIIRDGKVISPVSPEERLEAGDTLFFSGNTQSIYNLIKRDNGISIPTEATRDLEEQFNFVEAVIPAHSELVGVRIKDSDFRKRYDASIIAIHRNGKRVPGKVGEMQLAGGDFLLLLAGENGESRNHEKDLFFLSVPKKVRPVREKWAGKAGLLGFLLLVLGVIGVFPLFHVCVVVLAGLVFLGILGLSDIRREFDLSLLVVLVCSLALGVALEKSGTAALIAQGLIGASAQAGSILVLTVLFISTTMLTALITNPAAVSIVFPIAMSIAEQMRLEYTPFMVAIAFAASGDFMTPIGYQTNLMVYGPGGYTFKDFFRVGTPLTALYAIICIIFISVYYKLI